MKLDLAKYTEVTLYLAPGKSSKDARVGSLHAKSQQYELPRHIFFIIFTSSS